MWSEDDGTFTHDRRLSGDPGEGEAADLNKWAVYQDYVIHAYLFLYGDFKEAHYSEGNQEVLKIQWIVFTLLFGIYLMNFLVAFMCDELVTLTERKKSQENKVMLQLSTEVIKTKIFFQKYICRCWRKKTPIVGNFYVIMEREPEAQSEALGKDEVGASENEKYDRLLECIQGLQADVKSMKYELRKDRKNK